jgi:hypothetical protein
VPIEIDRALVLAPHAGAGSAQPFGAGQILQPEQPRRGGQPAFGFVGTTHHEIRNLQAGQSHGPGATSDDVQLRVIPERVLSHGSTRRASICRSATASPIARRPGSRPRASPASALPSAVRAGVCRPRSRRRSASCSGRAAWLLPPPLVLAALYQLWRRPDLAQPPGPELNGADRGRLKVLSPEYAKPDKSGTPGTVAHDRPTLDRSRKRAPFRPFPGLATGTRVVIPSSPGHRPRRRVNRRRFEAKVHPHGALDHVRWKAVTGIARRGHGHRYAAPALRKSANVTSPPCERSWMADPATSAGLHAVWPGQYWRKRT